MSSWFRCLFLALLAVGLLDALVEPAEARRRRLKRLANDAGDPQWCAFAPTPQGNALDLSFVAPPGGQVTVNIGGIGSFAHDTYLDNLMVVHRSVLSDPLATFDYPSRLYTGCDCSLSSVGSFGLCTAACGANNETPRVPAFVVQPDGQAALDPLLFPFVRTFGPCGSGCDRFDGWLFPGSSLVAPENCGAPPTLCATEEVLLNSPGSVEAPPTDPAKSGSLLLNTQNCFPDGQECDLVSFPVTGLVPGEAYTLLGWWRFINVFGGATLQGLGVLTFEILPETASGTFDLEVFLSGGGSGRVVSLDDPVDPEPDCVPAGSPLVDCGGGCDLTCEANALLTLEAIADPGSRFYGWVGPCAGTPGQFEPSAFCSIALTEETAVTALFEPLITFDPPFLATPVGSASLSCDPGCGVAFTSQPGQRGGLWLSSQKVELEHGFETAFNVSDGGEGLAFVIQNQTDLVLTPSLGGFGAGLGYASEGAETGITSSLAVEIDASASGSELIAGHIAVQTDGVNPNGWQPQFRLGPAWPLASSNFSGTSGTSGERVRLRYLPPGILEVYFGGLRIPVLTTTVDLENLGGQSILDSDGKAWVGFTGTSGEIDNWTISPFHSPLHQPFAPVLQDAVPFHDILNGWRFESRAAWEYYRFDSTGALWVELDLTQLSGNANLFARSSATPTRADFDCASTQLAQTDEQCLVVAPPSDTLWIGVNNEELSFPGIDFTLLARRGPSALPSGPLLLVDNDDDDPDVRAFYSEALDALQLAYDVWDTAVMGADPDVATLEGYAAVVWFSGDAFGSVSNPVAGPEAAGEAALAGYLNKGGCLFMSSQDYVYDRGVTPFAGTYLGLDSGADAAQTQVVGENLFAGLGPFTLNPRGQSFPDILTTSGGAQAAFSADFGNAALSRDGGAYETVFFGFQFEALPTQEAREEVMARALGACIPTSFCDHGFHLELSQQDVSGDETFEACNSIWAGDFFSVSGSARLSAPNFVALGNDFSVALGGDLEVGTP